MSFPFSHREISNLLLCGLKRLWGFNHHLVTVLFAGIGLVERYVLPHLHIPIVVSVDFTEDWVESTDGAHLLRSNRLYEIVSGSFLFVLPKKFVVSTINHLKSKADSGGVALQPLTHTNEALSALESCGIEFFHWFDVVGE